jgi:hypothetical protein
LLACWSHTACKLQDWRRYLHCRLCPLFSRVEDTGVTGSPSCAATYCSRNPASPVANLQANENTSHLLSGMCESTAKGWGAGPRHARNTPLQKTADSAGACDGARLFNAIGWWWMASSAVARMYASQQAPASFICSHQSRVHRRRPALCKSRDLTYEMRESRGSCCIGAKYRARPCLNILEDGGAPRASHIETTRTRSSRPAGVADIRTRPCPFLGRSSRCRICECPPPQGGGDTRRRTACSSRLR